jgi:hypothetical protein
MIRLILPRDKTVFDHLEDVAHIVEVMELAGYQVDHLTAAWAWADYSDSFAASWLLLPQDDSEIVKIIREHTIEAED